MYTWHEWLAIRSQVGRKQGYPISNKADSLEPQSAPLWQGIPIDRLIEGLPVLLYLAHGVCCCCMGLVELWPVISSFHSLHRVRLCSPLQPLGLSLTYMLVYSAIMSRITRVWDNYIYIVTGAVRRPDGDVAPSGSPSVLRNREWWSYATDRMTDWLIDWPTGRPTGWWWRSEPLVLRLRPDWMVRLGWIYRWRAPSTRREYLVDFQCSLYV